MVKLVYSVFCGKCGRIEKNHNGENLISNEHLRECSICRDTVHVFVRVPLNFDEWRKELAEKLILVQMKLHGANSIEHKVFIDLIEPIRLEILVGLETGSADAHSLVTLDKKKVKEK